MTKGGGGCLLCRDDDDGREKEACRDSGGATFVPRSHHGDFLSETPIRPEMRRRSSRLPRHVGWHDMLISCWCLVTICCHGRRHSRWCLVTIRCHGSEWFGCSAEASGLTRHFQPPWRMPCLLGHRLRLSLRRGVGVVLFRPRQTLNTVPSQPSARESGTLSADTAKSRAKASIAQSASHGAPRRRCCLGRCLLSARQQLLRGSAFISRGHWH